MSLPRHIVISGAGLAGSLLAVMLGRRGYEVSVYEKRSDLRKAEITAGRSINLALAERGIDALKRAGLFDDVEKLLIPMRGRMLHSVSGELEFSPYGQRPREVIYSVSRAELNCLMMTEAEKLPGVSLYFEQQCESIDIDESSITVVDGRDSDSRPGGSRRGESRIVEYQVLIGCDGVGSAVRKAIMDSVGGECDIDMLDHDYKELTIPAGPKGEFLIEKEALHIWPRGGFMLIALPNLGGSYTVTLFLAKRGEPSFESLADNNDVQAFFAKNFADALDLMPDIAEQFQANPAGELGTIRCWPWSAKGSAMILGDAAHAIVPFHGQGMNAGFEDCAQLIQLLDEHEDDWPEVMRKFESLRKPNADAIADMAVENYLIMRESVADEQFQMKKELGFELERRFSNRFIPRYSMVMFHNIPYDDAKLRGQIQHELLDELVAGKTSVSEVDFELAEARVRELLAPIEGMDAEIG